MTIRQKKTLIRIIAAFAVCIALYFIPLDGIWSLLLFCIPYLIAGYDVLRDAARNIIHGQIFDEKFLMAIATLGAFAVGEYPEAAGVMIFYQIGELFQSIAVGKSRKSIASLMDMRPEYATVLRGGDELTVSPEEVGIGEIILVKPGERIPLDGIIIDGSTSVDTSSLTGESLPADLSAGDRAISGSVNISGVIRIRTESGYGESTVAKILEAVENSSAKKAKTENFITRFARYYTPCVVIGALLLAVLPPLLLRNGWKIWINRALIFLMVSCPCALVVSVPLSFFGGIGGASKRGILIKGANYLEALAKTDTVVFDKTGTLTKGSFRVNAIHPTDIPEAELLDIAAAAECFSAHPVGISIVEAHGGHINKSRIGTIEELPGKGIKAEVDGAVYYVGNGALMDEAGAGWRPCHLGGTVIHISRKDKYLGHIVINDEVKPDSREAVAGLKKAGVSRTVILSGDLEKNTAAVAAEVGADEYRAQLLPDQKVEELEKLMSGAHVTAFVGDGINDAPVLARADVGIAMGAMGSDAAIESADVVLMDDKPSKLPTAIKLARRTMHIVKENIVFALGVKLIILVLTAFGRTDMWIAVFGDVGVMIIAILNAARTMLKR